MSFCDVYIGRTDDPSFIAGRNTHDGSVPTRRSPLFPPAKHPFYGAFGHFHDRLKDGRFVGEKTDWAGRVVPATKGQMEAFVSEIYDGDVTYSPTTQFPWLLNQLNELRAFVVALEDDGRWALVATEL